MRVFDASVHNAIANHPSVRPSFPWVEGEVSFDEEVRLTDAYVFLVNEDRDAAAIFEWSAPRVYQVHSMSLPSCRGKAVIEVGKRMIAWMQAEMGARMIWGQTPVDNRAARMFNRLMGARSEGMRGHHVTGECELFVWGRG